MAGYFRNSDFKKDLYYQKDSFKEILRIASKAGRDIRINEIRKLNNFPYARKLKGDISIQEIFENNRNEFKAINEDRLRPAIVEEIEKFLLCSKFENGYTYYECPKCGDLYICYFLLTIWRFRRLFDGGIFQKNKKIFSSTKKISSIIARGLKKFI